MLCRLLAGSDQLAESGSGVQAPKSPLSGLRHQARFPPPGPSPPDLDASPRLRVLSILVLATKRASTDNLRSSQWQDDHFVIHYASVGYPKCHDPMGHCGVVG